MSDFTHAGWAIFVGAATVIGLLGCLWLLFIASKRTVMADNNTTGHVFDEDLVEMNNPLPRWWMWLFILTVVFAFGYIAVFPGLGSLPGQLGWTSINQFEAEQKAADAAMAPLYAGLAATPPEQLRRDPKAMAIGERLFINHCATCHGSDARGTKGFPNLTDTDWLHGGTPAKIAESITQGRVGMMPPMAAAIGSPQDVRNVAHHVLSLSTSAHNPIWAAAGRPKYAACAACHGADGRGNTALGAPNLADKVWLHGWGEESIVAMVTHGKTNTMPAQAGRLTPEQIHVLASYVWSLSQGSAPAPP